MLVVSDATPLNILIRIKFTHILPRLYNTIIIPRAVERELSDVRTPRVIQEWLAKRPVWLQTRHPKTVLHFRALGPGEREAISLAQELGADLFLADDKQARRAARLLGLNVTGTLGILGEASRRRLIDLPSALERLKTSDFFLSEDLIEALIKRREADE